MIISTITKIMYDYINNNMNKSMINNHKVKYAQYQHQDDTHSIEIQ